MWWNLVNLATDKFLENYVAKQEWSLIGNYQPCKHTFTWLVSNKFATIRKYLMIKHQHLKIPFSSFLQEGPPERNKICKMDGVWPLCLDRCRPAGCGKNRLTLYFPTSVLRYKTASPNAPRPRVRTLVYGSSDALPSVNDSSAIIKTEGNDQTWYLWAKIEMWLASIKDIRHLRDFSRARTRSSKYRPPRWHSAWKWMNYILIHIAPKMKPYHGKKW